MICVSTIAVVKAQEKISISNFRVEDVSDSEINVTVDYKYVGQTGKEFSIYAYPQNGEGKSMSRNIKTNLIPLKNGNNSASFTITKRSPGKDFRSESIKICMLKVKQFIFCEEYSLSKSWKTETAATNLDSDPEIVNFMVDPKSINLGETVKFYWEVKNAIKVQLYYGDTQIIDERIWPSDGVWSWPLLMNGTFEFQDLRKSTTFRLSATNKAGKKITKKFNAVVSSKKCRVTISITGKDNKYTDHINIYKVISNNTNEFQFKSPVTTIQNPGKPAHKKAVISLLPGEYIISPFDGGRQFDHKYGALYVMYNPNHLRFNCNGGNNLDVSFSADSSKHFSEKE